MGGTLRKLLNLYPGEEKKAGLFALLAFLWSLGGYGFLTLSEGMFLEHIGAQALPPVYLGIAICMCALSSFLLFSFHRIRLHILLTGVIVGAIACNLFIYLLLKTSYSNSASFWYLFKILGWIVPVATYVCFWAFVDQYYDLQDAKRFFCLFNSILFLGDACAGGIISCALETLGIDHLIALFILLMTASLPLIYIIFKRVHAIPEGAAEEMQPSLKIIPSSLIKIILRSRFTLILLSLYFIMQVLAITTEYNYMASFENAFRLKDEKGELTVFLGTCGMWVSLGNMVFCLLFYSRLIKKIGINNIVLISPTFFLGLFLIWSWRDALPIAIFGFLAREGMVYAFDDNNLNLLVSGVPTKAKNQVRIAIESFFEPIGMVISALLLLALQGYSYVLGLFLSFIALGVVFFLRNHYHKAIFLNLVANSIRFEKKATDWIASFTKREKKEVEFHLLSKLRIAEESTQLLAYEYLLKIQNPRLLPRLLNQFNRLSISGKIKAIDLLDESVWAKENIVIEHLERWRKVLPHPSIKSSIHFYFARHALLRPEKVVSDLQNEHIGLRGAAILSLQIAAKENAAFASIASERLYYMLASEDEQEVSMAIRILGMDKEQPDNLEVLAPFLKHPSQKIHRMAAHSISAIAHPNWKVYASSLVSSLAHVRDPETRISYLTALEKFSDPHSIKQLILAAVHFLPFERKRIETLVVKIGASSTQDLLAIVQDAKIHVRSRLLAGKILGKVSINDLRQNLYPLVLDEIRRAHFYFYHSQTIQVHFSENDLSILQNALFTGYESIVDFIIQILGVAGSIEESEILSHTLRSKNRKIRAQAVETLEKTCDPRIFSLLEPFIEDAEPEIKQKHYLKLGGEPLDLPQLLDILSHSGSLTDQIVSLSLQARMNAPGWKELLRKKLESNEAIFHHLANELLEQIT